MNIIKSIFSFTGRVGRVHFAIYLLFFFLGCFIFNAAIISISGLMFGSVTLFQIIKSEPILFIFLLLSLIIYLIIKYSHIIRRIQDLNKSKNESKIYKTLILIDVISFILISVHFYIQPKINYELISKYLQLLQSNRELSNQIYSISSNEINKSLSLMDNLAIVNICYMIILFISIICILVLSSLKGTDGENKFGPKPAPFWKKTILPNNNRSK